MGAPLEILNERLVAGEPVGDLRVRPAPLKAFTIGGELIPRLVDEIPILAVAALAAEGTSVIGDAEELRVKETDRLAVMARQLRAMGAELEETSDGLVIPGGQQLQGPEGQHPAGRHDQGQPQHQGKQQTKIEGLALTRRIVQFAGDGRQGDCVIGRQHAFEGHQQGQQQHHFAPLIRPLNQGRQGGHRFRFHRRADRSATERQRVTLGRSEPGGRLLAGSLGGDGNAWRGACSHPFEIKAQQQAD